MHTTQTEMLTHGEMAELLSALPNVGDYWMSVWYLLRGEQALHKRELAWSTHCTRIESREYPCIMSVLREHASDSSRFRCRFVLRYHPKEMATTL